MITKAAANSSEEDGMNWKYGMWVGVYETEEKGMGWDE